MHPPMNDVEAATRALEAYVSANRQSEVLSIAGAVRSVRDELPSCTLSSDEIAHLAERVMTLRNCNVAFDQAVTVAAHETNAALSR